MGVDLAFCASHTSAPLGCGELLESMLLPDKVKRHLILLVMGKANGLLILILRVLSDLDMYLINKHQVTTLRNGACGRSIVRHWYFCHVQCSDLQKLSSLLSMYLPCYQIS